MKSFFITGTDTDVGKTFVACSLIEAFNHLGLKTIGYKPISAGCERDNEVLVNGDAKRLLAASSVDLHLSEVNPIAFEPPIAPHIAAKQVNSLISGDDIVAGWHHLANKSPDILITEGAGGWALPVSNTQTLPDILQPLPQEVILVVGMRLGCLNHALLTASAIQQSGFKLAGWVANHLSEQMLVAEENIVTLQAMIKAPLLGVMPWFTDTKQSLTTGRKVTQTLTIESLLI